MAPSTSRSLWLVGCLLVLSFVALLLRAVAPTTLHRLCHLAESKRSWVPASLVVLAAFAALLVANALYAGYLDHAEPNVGSVSWLLLKGAPLYHAIDYPARYSLLYGPTSYLSFALALWIGGGTALSLKGMVLVANVVMGYFSWRTYRRLFDAPTSLFVLAVVLLFSLVPRPNHYLFQVRADVLIMCGMAVGLFAASHPSRTVATLTLALAGACVVDGKASAFIYVIPLLAILLGKHGWRASFAAVACMLGLAALPFLLPNISAKSYLQWIHAARGHPSNFSDLASTLRTLPILIAPLVLMCGPTPWRDAAFMAYLRESRLRLLALGLCLGSAVVASSRIGAGSHHILPFVPVLGYEYALLYRSVGAPFARQRPWTFRYLWACLAVVVVFRVGGGLMEILSPWGRWNWAQAVRDDVHSILRSHSTREVAMGCGEAERAVTYFRPELVFASNHLPVDEQALADMDLDGIELPEATVSSLASCAVGVWLIPKGEIPFALDNAFAALYPQSVPRQPLFPVSFRETFARHYGKKESTAYFDLWACERPGTIK
jgi:hypothetical protein